MNLFTHVVKVLFLQILIAFAVATLTYWFGGGLDKLSPNLNWPITLYFSALMIFPVVLAAKNRNGRLFLAMFCCAMSQMTAVAISINDPYYWGALWKLSMVLFAITLAASVYSQAIINFLIGCIGFLMVDKFGERIPPETMAAGAITWIYFINFLFANSALWGTVSAIVRFKPDDDEPGQESDQVPEEWQKAA